MHNEDAADFCCYSLHHQRVRSSSRAGSAVIRGLKGVAWRKSKDTCLKQGAKDRVYSKNSTVVYDDMHALSRTTLRRASLESVMGNDDCG